jgi:uncharacterized protein (TIGR03086 family)
MTEMHELHRRAGEILKDVVSRVRPEHLGRATPCEEWDVRALLHHIAWSNLWVVPLVHGQSLAEAGSGLEGDVLGDDPVGATRRSIDQASDAYAEPGTMDAPVELSRGTAPGREYCGERMNDLTVHAWDLARGIGENVELDPECMEASIEVHRPLEPFLRPAGELGPDVEVPDGADAQTRYLAFFGRRADWAPPDG